MSGKVVTCPACRFRQRLVLIKEKAPDAVLDADSIQSEPRSTEASQVVFDLQRPTSRDAFLPPRVKDKARTAEMAGQASVTESAVPCLPPSARALKLLPPRYTLDPDLERETLLPEVDIQAAGVPWGINTSLTRIHRGNTAVEVQSLSLAEKQRRKSMRVAIVYLISVLLLVLLLVWLMQSTDSGI